MVNSSPKILVRSVCFFSDIGSGSFACSLELAEGVFGVIEVKSNLTRKKVEEAISSLSHVENLTIPSPTVTIGSNSLKRPLRVLFSYEGATWNTIIDELRKNNADNLFDLICVIKRGVLVKRGRLMFGYDKATNEKIDKDLIIETQASALGFLYYYLIEYGSGFSTGNMSLKEYFHPLEKWGKLDNK